jgi:hypothetical protein
MFSLLHALTAHIADEYVLKIVSNYYLVVAIWTFEQPSQLASAMVHYSSRYLNSYKKIYAGLDHNPRARILAVYCVFNRGYL